MQSPEPLAGWFRAPKLTRARVILALTVAVTSVVMQIAFPPRQLLFAQQIVDVVAMALTMWLVGFHLLLLPTFIVEFIPVVDMLPTWTGCVVAVIALRKRAQPAGSSATPPLIELPPSHDRPPPPIAGSVADEEKPSP